MDWLPCFLKLFHLGLNGLSGEAMSLGKCLKSHVSTYAWHLRRDPDELPFCAEAQRSALLQKWNSRLKTYALSTAEIESYRCKQVPKVCWNRVPLLKERRHARAFCIGCTIEIITLISEGNQKNRTLWLWEHGSLNWGSENFPLFWMETVSKALWSYGLLWHYMNTYW